MIRNRTEAIDLLLDNLEEESKDPAASRYGNEEEIIEEGVALLGPFLRNPERHDEHARLIIESVANNIFQHQMKQMLPLINWRLIRRLLRPSFDDWIGKRSELLNSSRERLVEDLEPGELLLDILPIRRAGSEADWTSHGKALHIITVKTAITPSADFDLQSISYRLEIEGEGIQFVDAHPLTGTELEGERVSTKSATNKRSSEITNSSGVSASIKAPSANVGTDLTLTAKDQSEHEATDGSQFTEDEHQQRVVSSAVGKVAHWHLLRTKTQRLVGGYTFEGHFLAPENLKGIQVASTLSAHLSGWGPTEVSDTRSMDLPSC